MQSVDKDTASGGRSNIFITKDGVPRMLQLVTIKPTTEMNSSAKNGKPTTVTVVPGATFGINSNSSQQKVQLDSGNSSRASSQSAPKLRPIHIAARSEERDQVMQQLSPNESAGSPPDLDRTEDTQEEFEKRIQAQIDKNVQLENGRFKGKPIRRQLHEIDGQCIEEFGVEELTKVMEEEEKCKKQMIAESNHLVDMASVAGPPARTARRSTPKRCEKPPKTDEEIQAENQKNEKINALLQSAKSEILQQDSKMATSSSAGSSSSTVNIPRKRSIAQEEVEQHKEEPKSVPAKVGRGKWARPKKINVKSEASTENSPSSENNAGNEQSPNTNAQVPQMAEEVEQNTEPNEETTPETRRTRHQNRQSELDRLLLMDFGPKEGGTLKDLEDAKGGKVSSTPRRAALAQNRRLDLTPLPKKRKMPARSGRGRKRRYESESDANSMSGIANEEEVAEEVELPVRDEMEVDNVNESGKREDEERNDASGPISQSPDRDADDEKEAQDSAEDERMDEDFSAHDHQGSSTGATSTAAARPKVSPRPVGRPKSVKPVISLFNGKSTNLPPPLPKRANVEPAPARAMALEKEETEVYVPPGKTYDWTTWTSPEFVVFVTVTTESKKTIEIFRREEIDGKMLNLVEDWDAFRKIMDLPYGPFVKICHALQICDELNQFPTEE